MYRMAIVLSLLTATGGTAQGFTGTYEGIANDSPATLVLKSESGTVTGTISDGYDLLTINGHFEGDMVTGSIAGAAAPLHFHATSAAGEVRFTVYPVEWSGEVNHDGGSEIVFTLVSSSASRARGAPQAHPSGRRDAVLVGSWMKEDITTDPGFSFVSVTVMELHPDGSFVQFDGGSAGGSAGVSVRGAPNGEALHAQWRVANGTVELLPAGIDTWIPVAQFHVEGDRLLLTYVEDGRREIWYRR